MGKRLVCFVRRNEKMMNVTTKLIILQSCKSTKTLLNVAKI